jgi:6-phosphogluconolactonase (cycloisomerase 2 family)
MEMPRSQFGVFGTTDQPIRARLATLVASVLLLLSVGSCGGGGGSGSYTIGGSVSGLPKGVQFQLDLAFTDAVTGMQSGGTANIVANGPFTFPIQVSSGDPYQVYTTPPSGAPPPPAYNCVVANGSGIATSNVTTVAVTCSAIPTVTFDVTVSGLTAGAQVVIGDGASNSTVTVAANGETTLQEPLVLPAAYHIYVLSQPIGLSCISTNNSGTVTSTAPVNVGVTCSPITEYLYALGCIGSASFEQLEQFGIGADGLPTPLNAPLIQINPGACPAAVASVAADATGHYLYVTGGGGLLSQFGIGLGGVLTPLSPATVATGNVPQAVITDPIGQFVYVVNMADNTVSQYAIGATGALTPLSVPTVPTGNTPTAIAIDPKGRYVYVLNSMDNTLSQYGLGSGGALTPLSPSTVVTGTTPAAIAVDPSGQFVYVANSIDGTVSQYAIGSSGALTPLSTPSVTNGSGATSIAVDPAGSFAYLANNTGAMSEYSTGSSGALTEFDTLPGNGGDAFNLIVVDPTGHFAYQSNGIVLSEYALGPAGVLTPVTVTGNAVNAPSEVSSIAIIKAN